MDVLITAWRAAGCPDVELPTRQGRCARCGQHGPLLPVAGVVSKVFTGYDGWADPTQGGLCSPCAWGYRHPPLRAAAHLVTRAGWLRTLTPVGVCGHLERPMPVDEALIVPLHPGRKHLAPTAAWGRITVEDAQLTWTPADVERLTAVRRLRRLGFGSRMLTAPAPPWGVFRRLPDWTYAGVQADWSALAPWRSRRPWLDLAVHITVGDAAAPAPMVTRLRPQPSPTREASR